jgi:hypothetical protein
VTEERQPRGTHRTRVRSLAGRKDTAHYVLIDVGTKGECDLLGDARITPRGVAPLDLDNGVISSLDGPLGPVRRRAGENSDRYLRVRND